ncbi:MAG: hypothetical protein MI919_06110, partial [Holophagales bacterium]|nr:hypothetical protein [Holophagales bacterium]
GSQAELGTLREGAESTETEAAERARLDRLLFRLEAVARAYGISATTGAAVRAAVVAPGIFRLAAKRQLVAFVASAQAAGDSGTAELVAQLAPEELRAELEGLGSRAAWFHRDITGWVVPNIEKYGVETALHQVNGLRGKEYWGKGMPRYGAIEDRQALVFAIQEKLQATPIPSSSEDGKRRAIEELRQAREQVIADSSDRDRVELRKSARKAIVETPLPKTSLGQAFAAELAGSVGLDPEAARKVASGDLLKMAFVKLCELAGVDAEALLEAFGKGKKALMALVRDPSKVLAFLSGAVGGAFELLKKNFLSLVTGGVVGFLTGAAVGGSITLPTRWNLKSTAGFLLQLAGVTVERVWELVKKLLGEKGAAWVERAAGPILTLFTGEGSTVMERMTAQVAQIKDTALEALKSWALDSVVGPAITKIVTLFTPVGAIVGAISTIMGLIDTIRTWGARIASVVTTVFDSLTMIAEGKVEPAAKAIYNAIAGIFPVLLGFLTGFVFGNAKLFTKIGDAFKAIGNKIWSIVESMVEFVVSPFRKKSSVGDPKRSKDPDHGKKVRKGLAEIDEKEKLYLDDGKIRLADARKVAAAVARSHPVFDSIRVIDGGSSWDYEYKASPMERKDGEKKAEGESGGEKLLSSIRYDPGLEKELVANADIVNVFFGTLREIVRRIAVKANVENAGRVRRLVICETHESMESQAGSDSPAPALYKDGTLFLGPKVTRILTRFLKRVDRGLKKGKKIQVRSSDLPGLVPLIHEAFHGMQGGLDSELKQRLPPVWHFVVDSLNEITTRIRFRETLITMVRLAAEKRGASSPGVDFRAEEMFAKPIYQLGTKLKLANLKERIRAWWKGEEAFADIEPEPEDEVRAMLRLLNAAGLDPVKDRNRVLALSVSRDPEGVLNKLLKHARVSRQEKARILEAIRSRRFGGICREWPEIDPASLSRFRAEKGI